MIVQTRLNGLNLTKSAIHTHREIGPKSNLSRLKGQQREITVDLFSLSLNGARHYFIAEEIHGDLSAGLGPILCVASLSLRHLHHQFERRDVLFELAFEGAPVQHYTPGSLLSLVLFSLCPTVFLCFDMGVVH